MSSSQYRRDWYDRPNGNWTCGRASTGCPCAVGPSRTGACENTAVCEPKRLDQGWGCTRSPIMGGPCSEGPLPDGQCCRKQAACSPVKAVRQRRKVFVIGCLMLVTGGLMLGLSGPERNQMISAGSLTSHHAAISAGKDCQTCHAAGEQSIFQWVGGLVGWTSQNKPLPQNHFSQTDQCIECHREMFDVRQARSAHNLPARELAKITETKSNHHFRFQDLFGSMSKVSPELDCATCHREHQGPHHDLKAMTNQQCQSCHAEAFDSFAHGHPEFGNWPHRRRTRIAFDHVSHQSLHFAESGTVFNCNRCHLDDDAQISKPLAGFDQACASCHERGILDQGQQGLPLLALPVIDLQLLQQQGLALERWPKQADGVFDGVLPPLMQVLLSSDQAVHEAMQRLGEDVDFSMIDETDPQQLKDAYVVAKAILDLMDLLREQGNEGMQQQFQAAVNNPSNESLSELIERTPPELLRAVAEAWFPQSEESSSASAKLAPEQLSIAQVLASQSIGKRTPISDYLVEQVQYQLQGEVGDDGRIPRNQLREADLQLEAEYQSFLNQSTGIPSLQASLPLQQERELLLENPLKGLLVEQAPDRQPDDVNEQSQSEAGTTQSPETDLAQGPIDNEKQRLTEQGKPSFNEQTPPIGAGGNQSNVSTQPRMPSGRWSYEELSMTLKYHPEGHADAVMKDFIDFLAAVPDSQREGALSNATEALFGEFAIGRCTDCHSVDDPRSFAETEDGIAITPGWIVNWKAALRDPRQREFTRFSHRPHLIQPGLSDCSACHQPDPAAEVQNQYSNLDPFQHRSGFYPVKKQSCVACHHQQAKTDQCTTCHHYHVNSHSHGSR